jgi:hypothetical protein
LIPHVIADQKLSFEGKSSWNGAEEREIEENIPEKASLLNSTVGVA